MSKALSFSHCKKHFSHMGTCSTRQPALIINTDAWKKSSHREFHETHVVLRKCKNVSRCTFGPVFNDATHLYILDCDADFVLCYVTNATFPNVKHAYLASDRCRFHICSHFPNAEVSVEGMYNRYPKVKLCNRSDFPRFKQAFKSYDIRKTPKW